MYNIVVKNKLNNKDIGNYNTLSQYNKNQYLASLSIIFATDKLNFLFSNSNIFLKTIRKKGLQTFSKSKLIKNLFKNYASEGKLSIK